MLHLSQELPPLLAAQCGWSGVRLSRASDKDGIAICRRLYARTTITLSSMPHQFAVRAVWHITPPVLIDVTPVRSETNIRFRPLSTLRDTYASSVARVSQCDSREA
jgi:hypothetical protein